MDPRQYRALLRRSFSFFSEKAFRSLNPATPYQHGDHLDVIAYHLERCWRGDIKRLIINVPPRSLKSHYASVALPAFLLGHDPSAQIICVSYGFDLAAKFSADTRNVMQSSWYRSLFSTRLSASKQSVSELATTANGSRLATSVGGVLTGRGADFIILDDPIKPDEAISESVRATVNDWYDHTLYSRLNNKAKGCIIIVMQRLHEDDLVGHVAGDDWTVLKLPAIATEDYVVDYESLGQERRRAWRQGEALHPERESLEVLAQIKAQMGSYNFNAQYLQAPVPPEGNLVKRAWFRSYTPAERPPRFDQIVQSWDTASTLSELSSYSVCTTWGIKDGRLYLLDVLRRRMEFPTLIRAVHEKALQFGPTVLLIEDKGSGIDLVRSLRDQGLAQVKGCKPTCDKRERLMAQTPRIENGAVYLPEEAPWLDDYVNELISFPRSKYSDQVDSTSQALQWINTCLAEPSYLQYLRMMTSPSFAADQAKREKRLLEIYESARRRIIEGQNR